MKRINLANSNFENDVEYTIINFNDGEKHLKIISEIDHKENYLIQTRISSLDDMFILLQCCDILNRHGVMFEIYISYLLTMRMDRVMNFNEAFSLDIIKNMLILTKATKISIFECHSNRLMLENPDLFVNAIDGPRDPDCIYVLPDDGAWERYRSFLTFDMECFIGHKKRDLNTGRIEKLELTNDPNLNNNYPFYVWDDLCDAGGTFKLIATELDKIDPNRKKYLHISHAVNLQGILDLSKIYDKIFITNSYKDWNNLPDNVIVKNMI